MRNALLGLSFVALGLVLAGCDENDTVSLRVRIQDDLSGTLTASSLALPTTAGGIENAARGATFEGRVQVIASSGRFAQVSDLKVSDIVFTAGEGANGMRWARIEVPQGAAAAWPEVFVPLSEKERSQATSALDPSGKSKDVGANLKIVVELPAKVVGNGLVGKARGTKSDTDGAFATLIVPIQTAKAASDSLVWHLTWQR